MKIILKKDVVGTGKRGEIKEVSDGYARNFLLKKDLAEQVTEGVLTRLQSQVQKKTKEAEEELRTCQRDTAKLDGGELEFFEKINEDGRLYAAVTPTKIATLIKKQYQIEIDPKQVFVPVPIKVAGDHRTLIKFGHGLEAEMTVTVSEA